MPTRAITLRGAPPTCAAQAAARRAVRLDGVVLPPRPPSAESRAERRMPMSRLKASRGTCVKRVLKGRLLACLVLLSVLAAGCASGRDAANPYGSLQTPGPPPPARTSSHVCAVGMPTLIVASANGGATWQTSHRTTTGDPFMEVLFGVAFADARHGWAVGKAGVIMATTDGGAGWAVQHEGTKDGCLLGVATTDARHAWAVGFVDSGAHSLILATADAGKTWKQQYRGPRALTAVAFSDDKHGWAVGGGGIVATSDGGAHWRVLREAGTLVFKDVACSDPRHCWVVGGVEGIVKEPGFVLATSDGGAHWTTQLSGTNDRLNSVAFLGPRRGWIVGNEGVLYRTTDGGATWALTHMNPSWELGAVAFSDARHGWAVVHPHWEPSTVSSSDAKHGWGLLQQLALLTTSDGGSTWAAVRTAHALASPAILTDVACKDDPGSR